MQFYTDKYEISLLTLLSSFPEKFVRSEPEAASIILLHVNANAFVEPDWKLELPPMRPDASVLVFIEGAADYKAGHKIFRLNRGCVRYIGVPQPIGALRYKGRYVRATALERLIKNKQTTEAVQT